MKQVIIKSIDWLSVKLGGASTTLAFITANPLAAWIGVLAGLSTLVYNGFRIIQAIMTWKKENKKQQ